MKVLIPYDGTKEAENALLELQNAGFGQRDEILIVITDVFLPESAEDFSKACRERKLRLEGSGNCSYVPARRRLEEERLLSREIHRRLSSDFPAWNIKIETLPGLSLVSSEVMAKAAVWKADLIVLGSQKSEVEASSNGYKSSLWRVVSEAECEVRLADGTKRGKSAVKPDHAFLENKKRLSEKQKIELLKTSNDIAVTLLQKENGSSGIIRSTENREQIPKLTTRQHRHKPQHEINSFATAAVAF